MQIVTLYTDGTALAHEYDLTHHGAKLGWQCDQCLQHHADEDEAAECCQPMIREGYACPVCDAFHAEEGNAAECCLTGGIAGEAPSRALCRIGKATDYQPKKSRSQA
jgi:hypothetical protein